MKIIISPAKRMAEDPDSLPPRQLPVFLERAERLKRYLQSLDCEKLKALLACNDSIAELNYRRYQRMDLRRNPSPALFSYEGIQYQYMAPRVFDQGCLDYLEERLRILSGFYGLLRPFDGVVPYRLEMQAKLNTDFCRSVYDFWGDAISRELARGEELILNLASQEYSRAAKRRLPGGVRFITCYFGERAGDKLKEKGVYVKMARGELVRLMAENRVEAPEEIKRFTPQNFRFQEELSSENHYVFVRDPSAHRGIK